MILLRDIILINIINKNLFYKNILYVVFSNNNNSNNKCIKINIINKQDIFLLIILVITILKW